MRRQDRALTLTNRLADVEAGQIAHGEGPHGHAEIAQRGIDLLRRGAFLEQELRLAAVLEQHPVADEAIADTHHHRDLLQLPADGHGAGQHFVAGPCAAHHFQQAHDVGGAEEMQADHIFRAPGEGGDGVQIQRRSVGGENRAGFAHCIQTLEDLLLDGHVFEYRFDHQVDIGQRRVVGDAFDQRQPLDHGRFAQAAAFDARRIGVTGTLQGALQRLVADFQQFHRHAGIGEAQGDADAHGAAADHRRRSNLARAGIDGQVGDLGGLALGEEGMHQRRALR